MVEIQSIFQEILSITTIEWKFSRSAWLVFQKLNETDFEHLKS